MRALMMIVCLVACSPAVPPPDAAGCGKDTDCKGDRVCEARVCVDPVVADTPPPAASDTTDTSDSPVAPAGSQVPPGPTGVASADGPAPAPRPRDVSSGERPAGPCNCLKGDVLCQMKCAQRDNPAGPSTFPNDRPQPNKNPLDARD